MNIPVVYEDDWLMVVDKPSGLLVVPTPKRERRTLTSILNEDSRGKGYLFGLHPCHRLDRETSGLIIYAKGKSVQKKMMTAFFEHKVRKTYMAFIQGQLSRPRGQIDTPIEGARALTRYEVLDQKKSFSVVRVFPQTGRTNQIRIHFKQIGHPLVGETKFAFRKDYALKSKRLCLHACSLEFAHPATGKMIALESVLPDDLAEFLKIHSN